MDEARGRNRNLECSLELGLLKDGLVAVQSFLNDRPDDACLLSHVAVRFAKANPADWLRYHHHVVDLIKLIDSGFIDFGSTPVGAVAHGALAHAIRINQERNNP